MPLNFPVEVKLGGSTHYPTVAEIAEWNTPIVRAAGVIAFVESVQPVGPFSTDDLAEPVEGMGVSLDGADYAQQLAEEAPADGQEVHEWMHLAGGANYVAMARSEEYSRCGGELLWSAGDAYIPGVSLNSVRFASEPAYRVGSRGYAYARTARARYQVPVPGAAKIIEKDMLAWAGVVASYVAQWIGVLLHYRKLAKNPQRRIATPNFYGLQAPLYIVHEAGKPAPVNLAELSVSTPKATTIVLRGRSVDDYTEVLWEKKIDLAGGQNKIRLVLYGFPSVPAMVVEIEDEKGNLVVLDYWKAYP